MTGLVGVPLVDQVIDTDGRSVVMLENRVLVLSALATQLLRDLRSGPLQLDEASSRLEAAFGVPPQGSARTVTEALAEELQTLGLLQIVSGT